MSLDKKIYLATLLAAIVIAVAMAIAVPRIDGGLIVHTEVPQAPSALTRAAVSL